MERSYGDGTYAFNSTEPLPARPSIESTTSTRLQKKRSVRRVRSDATRLTGKARAEPYPRVSDTSNRKSSIRDTVRKIFSRRSKVQEPPQPLSVQTTPLKYKSHNSQPPETIIEPERTPSAPLRSAASVDLPRIRSPNAVEFPKSRHLKPLVLPTPFDDPRSTLRRRKTLPSILIQGDDAKEIAAVINSSSPRFSDEPLPQNIGLAVSTSRQAKRRSRSAGDLREQALQAGPQRKRSDEIRFWRESIQTAILRTSGYTIDPETAVIEAEELKTPPRNSRLVQGSLRGSPPFDVHSPSAFGTELSRDLEDRVAKLESNLQYFQRSLDRLQSGKSRRTTEPGRSGPRRDSADFRTPSMLAEDLHVTLAPSDYRYAFEPSERPSTAPSRPARPPRPDENIPPVPAIARQPVAEPKPQPPRRPSRPDDPITPTQASESANLRSLYQMLNDERSARHKLESQLRDMRTEISDLQQQVSAQSQIQSQRSSYLFPTASELTAGSSRLRDLLAEAEGLSRRSMSPPAVVPSKVVSRFSASTRQESEAGATHTSSEETQEREAGLERTPRLDIGRQLGNMEEETASERLTYDEYKTPTQAAAFPLPPSYTREGAMF